jgi:hypothetical protein
MNDIEINFGKSVIMTANPLFNGRDSIAGLTRVQEFSYLGLSIQFDNRDMIKQICNKIRLLAQTFAPRLRHLSP